MIGHGSLISLFVDDFPEVHNAVVADSLPLGPNLIQFALSLQLELLLLLALVQAVVASFIQLLEASFECTDHIVLVFLENLTRGDKLLLRSF